MLPKLKLGIVGVGMVGQTHVRAALVIPEFELVAVADSDPAAFGLAAEYSIRAYRSHTEMLEDTRLDAVVVATPNRLHVPIGVDCLRAGAHLLVEKPIADSVESAQVLNAEARKADRVLMVGHHRRHYRRAAEARRIVQGGGIGDLVGVTVMWATLKPDDYFETSWRTQSGAGPVLINLIHEIDMLRFICGEITEVRANSSNSRRGHEVEDTAAAILSFDNGAIATVLATDSAATPWNIEMGIGENLLFPATWQDCYFFMGSRGSLSFPNMTHWSYRDSSGSGWKSQLEGKAISVAEHNPFLAQLNQFRAAIAGEEAPLISGVDGTRTLAATLAVLEASKTGKAVKV